MEIVIGAAIALGVIVGVISARRGYAKELADEQEIQEKLSKTKNKEKSRR